MSHRRDYGGRGYDDRERSPHRGHGHDDRSSYRSDNRGPRRNDDRGSRRDDGYGGDRGDGRGGRGYDGGRGERGGRGGRGENFGGGAPPMMPETRLPPLPDNVPIPDTGSRLPETLFRPGATEGQRFQVLTNHYLIQSLPVIKIYEYELRFEIAADSKRGAAGLQMTPALIEKAAKAALRALLFGTVAIFNGTSSLWSPTELVAPGAEGTEYAYMPDHTDARPNRVQITIRNVGTANIRRLVQYLTSNPQADIEKSMVWLNALFRHFPGSQDSWFARPKGLSFFIRERGLYMDLASTGGVLEAVRGLHQAVSTHFNCLSVNVDIATTPFYKPDNSLKNVAFAFAGCPPHANAQDFLRCDLNDVSDRLAAVRFCVTHDGGQRRHKKIKSKGLFRNPAQQGRYTDATATTFQLTDARTGQVRSITILDYFREKYGVNIQYPMLPLVDSNHGLFPLELCVTAPGERYKSVLEGRETADFIKFATSPAYVRSQQIGECVKRLDWHDQDVLQAHGVSVNPRMLQVPAVKLNAPPVCYSQRSDRTQVANGSWNLRNKSFVNPKALNSWGVLYIQKMSNHGQATHQEIEGFFHTFHGQFKIYGLTPPNGPPAIVVSQPHVDVKSALNDVAKETCRAFKCNRPDMIFVLFHEGTPANVYKTIKTIGEVEFGVPTQVMIVEKSLRGRGMQQYCANVCMKVNAKLGGVNSIVPLPPSLANSGLMIIGADVTHPTPAQLAMVPAPPSIAALTGTFDRDCCRYTAVCAPQTSTQESISAGASMPVFVSMADTLVDRYAERNDGRKPSKVIYFRDGVAESQIAELRNGEVKLLREAIGAHGGKLTAIVVQKRHHTRFFPLNSSNDKNGNVEPGTLVETGPNSTMAVAHGALQGTVRPSHYTIVENELGITKDELHQLIMHGTHSYGKATRAVHTHTAIYYADIVAERSTFRYRESNGKAHYVDVNEKLRHTQWWL